MFNSLVELEYYITKNNDIDSKLFEEQLRATVNGIRLKDELTKEYIKILRNVSFLDLKVFKSLFSKIEYIELGENRDSFLYQFGLKTPYSIIKSNNLEDIPRELIIKSVNKLIEIEFLKKEILGEEEEE